MIAVIADDITGAAEIGGIALSHGISCEVQTAFYPTTDVGMIIIDTNSRSCDKKAAIETVSAAARAVASIQPQWLYKKTDSVLRGNVVSEILAIMKCSSLARCLLVPANPSLGRTIEAGRYLIGGKPLHETDFARDPEYPAATSSVVKLLTKGSQVKVSLIKPGAISLPEGISVGEARTAEDLTVWADAIAPGTLPAGGGAFFSAILDARGFRTTSPLPYTREGRTLFICGSSAQSAKRSLADARVQDVPVHAMPDGLFHGDKVEGKIEIWADQVIASLEQWGLAIAAIDRPPVSDSSLAPRLRQYTAELAQRILSSCDMSNLYIEGGATAAAIISTMKWRRFRPVAQPAGGVVTMQTLDCPGLSLTVKPGSYPWPAGIWGPH